MLRNNKLFRERFLRWKNGELVYDKGRPIDQYEIGKDSISDAIYDQEILQASRNNYTRWGFDSTEDAYRRISNGLAPKPYLNDVVTEDAQVNRYVSGKDDDDKDFTDVIKGAAIAENPAVAEAVGLKWNKNGKVVQERTKADEQLGKNLAVLSTMSPTHPLNAAVTGAISKLSNLANVKQVYGMQLNGIKLSNSRQKELFNDLIVGNLAQKATSYVPAEFLPTLKPTPINVRNSIYNSTIPRLAQFRSNMTRAELTLTIQDMLNKSTYAEFPLATYQAAGKGNYRGFFNPSNNYISVVSDDNPYNAQLHEYRHLIDFNHMLVPEENKILDAAFTKDFRDPLAERIAAITDTRRVIIGPYNDMYMPVAKQNQLLKSTSKQDFLDAAKRANAYMNRYLTTLEQKHGEVPNSIYKAILKGTQKLGVGTGLSVGLNTPSTFDAFKQQRKYKSGKDDEQKPKNPYARALYNRWDPMGEYPSSLPQAIGMGIYSLYKALTSPDRKDWEPEIGNISPTGAKVADAAWRKRLGYNYDKKALPTWNGDTVSLPKELEREIPIDTNMLKTRIERNKKLRQKYAHLNEDPFVIEAQRVDELALEALRKTYTTGKPVGVNELSFNSRQWVIDGESVPTMSPLNVLKDYNIRYDKDSNSMYYSDEYDFNLFDWGIPGKSFRIRGKIDLDSLANNRYKSGKDGIYIKPKNRGKFTALKKRTGHSASWFKAHGTPALKKMAVFALNSKKWHKN